MKKTWSFFTVVVLVIIIVIISLLLWFIYANWTDFNPNTVATVFTGLIIMYGYYETKKREIAARHFIEKKNAYTEFINFICKLSSQSNQKNQKNQISEKEMINQIEKFKRVLITWGSADTIDAYNNYTRTSGKTVSDEDKETHVLFLMDDLLRNIRKDLGHDNAGLNSGELIGIFLNDESKEKLDKLI